MIRNLMIGAGLAALTAAAMAHDHGGPMADKDMTRDEMVAKVREHFGKMDANKDGVIARDEIADMREHRMEMRMGGAPGDMKWEEKLPDANEAFDRLDTNKDGSISREEFAKGREIRIEKRIAMVDKVKDKKGDHMIRMHRMGGGMGGGHMIVMADSNQDGKITLAEAEAMALKHFDEMDANKDGKVTSEERKAARPMMIKMREMHQEHAPKAS
jgi:Ca2+-binding EF-hand superfamily protein